MSEDKSGTVHQATNSTTATDVPVIEDGTEEGLFTTSNAKQDNPTVTTSVTIGQKTYTF